jgi:DNA ligase-1
VLSEVIYKKSADGTVYTWQYELNDDERRTITGTNGGKKVVSSWRKCKPKNLGKRNATTGPEQAQAEAEAEMRKRLDREYRKSIAELDNVPLGVMLAHKWDEWVEKGATWGNDHEAMAAQPKLDGIRALVDNRGAWTRDMQPHKNMKHILEALEPIREKHPDIWFDGELYNHKLKDDFNQISGLVRREKLNEAQQRDVENLVEYHVYDICGPGYSDLPFHRRSAVLDELSQWKEWGGPLIRVQTVFGTRPTIDEHEIWCAENGYEGQMVRDPASTYFHDSRVWGLLKRKEFLDGEFKIIRIEEGKGNWAGHAKRLTFDFNGIEVGAGIRGTRAQMKKLLEEWESWDLEVAEATVQYFKHLTPDGKARFATVKEFHPMGRRD